MEKTNAGHADHNINEFIGIISGWLNIITRYLDQTTGKLKESNRNVALRSR